MDRLAITPAQLGGLLVLWGFGAVTAMQALRWIMPRAGSAPVAATATFAPTIHGRGGGVTVRGTSPAAPDLTTTS